MPGMRDYLQVTSLQPTDGFWIDRIGQGSEFIEAVNFIPAALVWAGNAFYEGSAPPASSQLLSGWSMPVKATFPADETSARLIGWGAHVESGSLPTATFAITLALNDVLAATLTFHTDGTFSYVAASGAWVANVRDRVTAVAPTADATMNNFFFTIVGTLT